MSIHHSGSFPQIRQLRPMDHLQNEDDREEKRKRRAVKYNGREWTEGEEDLPVHPQATQEKKEGRNKSPTLYSEPVTAEKAKAWLLSFPTLEDKIAQLCFLNVEASYDLEKTRQIEEWIQLWRLGGIVFSGGDYRRQVYLLEHFKEISAFPLLFGNDFLHGLNLYFEGNIPSSLWDVKTSERRFLDLGKTLMSQNRRLGIQLQLDSPSRLGEEDAIAFSDSWRNAFRRGIREAFGVVGRRMSLQAHQEPIYKKEQVSSSLAASQTQETIHTRSLFLKEATDPALIISLLSSKEPRSLDGILVSHTLLPTFIEELSQAVKRGEISEQEIDRKVLRILIAKAHYFG